MSDFNTDTFLKSLEAYYLEQDWAAAISQIKANQDNLEPWLYHYNLGTFFARAEEFGAGRYHLEKSLMEGGPRVDILNNLDFILRYIGESDLTLSGLWYDRLVGTWSLLPSNLFIATTLFLLLLILLAVLWKGVRSPLALVCGVLIALIPVSVDRLWMSRYVTAIALTPVSVYEGPSSVFEVKYSVGAGAKMVVSPSASPHWYRITQPRSMVGWVRSEELGLLKK